MKVWLSRALNLALWLVGSSLLATGLILEFRLPPGSRGGAGLTLLGEGRHDWGDLHTVLAYAALGLVAAHLALHARWLWIVASQRIRWRLTLGLAAGLALPLAALLWPVQRQSPRGEHAQARPPPGLSSSLPGSH